MVDWGRPWDLVPMLLPGLWLTIGITSLAAGIGLVASLTAGLARVSQYRVIRVIATAYVEVFRGTSALVQLFFWFYVAPLFGFSFGPLETSVVALGLNVGAYGSEVVRGAITAVERGQREAAIALNMGRFTTMRHVVLPQAVPPMLPPLGNLLIELLKMTSLVSLIGMTELAFAGRQVLQTQGLARREETYFLILLLYLAVAVPIIVGIRVLERRSGAGLRSRATH